MRGVEQQPALYEAIMAPLDALSLWRQRQRLFGGLQGAILELGVGTGRNLAAYAPGTHVTAIDVDRRLLRAARRRAARHNVHLALADAQRLPFRDHSFDVVTSALVFCSIPDPAAALREVARVLRPTGRLVQLEHTRTDHALPDALLDTITPLWRTLAGGCHPNRDTPALLQALGWHLERHERQAGGLLRLIVAVPPLR